MSKISRFAITISFLVGIIGLASFQGNVQAADITAGPLEISYGGDKIFDELNFAPGDSRTKVITVKNNGSVAHSLALATRNVEGDLAPFIMIEPTIGSTIWSMSIADLAALPTQSRTVISSIDPGQTVSFDLVGSLGNVDNNSQGKNVTFDLVFGTQEVEPATSTGDTVNVQGTAGSFTLTSTSLTNTSFLGTNENATASATAQATSSATSTTAGGEVKGEQTGGGLTGELWVLLLIVPVLGALATFIIRAKLYRAVIVPVVSGAGVFILTFFSKGTVRPWIFYLILVIEVIFFFVLESYIRGRSQNAASPKK